MDARIRVLRVCTRLNVGGPAQQVTLLTRLLDPQRFDSRLVVGEPGPREGNMLDLRPDLADGIQDRILQIDGLGRDPNPLADIRAYRTLGREIDRFRPHVIHTHMAKAGTLARMAGMFRKVPVKVHTFHGTVFEGHFNPLVGRGLRLWERSIGRATTAVIPVSPTVGSQLIDAGFPREKVRMVPLGLDLQRFASVPQITGLLPKVVSLIARLAPVKDVELFFDAMELVRAEIPDVIARVIGDGPERARLQAKAPSWIEMMGNQADLPSLLASTGVVALTSRSEGSPVALIEALAAARPVVSVPVGGVVDILENRPGAVLTRDRSARSVADAIVAGLTNPDLANAAAAGRLEVIEDFGIDRLARDLAALYEELLERADVVVE
jgi:glycosyltransferase involved in cell wall biosynthesis